MTMTMMNRTVDCCFCSVGEKRGFEAIEADETLLAKCILIQSFHIPLNESLYVLRKWESISYIQLHERLCVKTLNI